MPNEISVNDSDDLTAGTDADATLSAEAHDIATSEESVDWSDDDHTTKSTEAPDESNTSDDDESSESLSVGQPEEDKVAKTDDKKDVQGGDEDKATADEGKPAEKVNAEAEAERQAEIRRAAGLAPIKGDDRYDELERKYVEASKESHRLVDEFNARNAALAELGVQIIRKSDGTFGLAPTEKYVTDLDVSAEVRAIFDSMPKAIQDAFDGDEARAHAIEHIAKEVHKMDKIKRPPLNASRDDIRLPDGVVNNIFADMTNTRLGEGEKARPFYADIEEQDVVDMMLEHYDNPAARDFLITANKTPENMKWFLDSLHAKVYRGRAPILAAMKDAKTQTEKKKMEKRKEASIGTGGEAGSGMRSARGTGLDEARSIAQSGGRGW